MVASFTQNQCQAGTMFPFSINHAPQGPNSSSATSKLSSEFDTTIPSPTAHSGSSTLNSTSSISSPTPKSALPDMAVYYQYDKDGVLQSTSTADPFLDQPFGNVNVDHYLQRGDTVGAFLAQRAMIYPAYTFPASFHGEVPQHDGACDQNQASCHDQNHADAHHQFEERYDSYGWDGDSQYGYPQMPAQPIYMAAPPQDKIYHYCNPEKVRHQHSLYSLLPILDPVRRFNCRNGPMIDVVEEGTGNILYHSVPKKLLVLFVGRTTMNRLLVTPYPHVEDLQNMQRIVMPRGLSSRSAWAILISWMKRATLPQYASDLEQFKVPHNLYAACTLAQTCSFVGLHKDAYRVDMTISQEHFVRPMYAEELDTMWVCMGPENRYMRAAIQATKQQIQDYRTGVFSKGRIQDNIMQLLELYPDMKEAIMGNDGGGQDLPLRVAEEDTRERDPETLTIAKRRGKAKVLRIVLDEQKSNEPRTGQNSGHGATGVEDPTE